MNFHLFCEFEGRERNFHVSGRATIGGIEFTVLTCNSCFNEIALPGKVEVTQEVMI